MPGKWSVTGERDSNELIVEADLDGWQAKFMSAATLTKHRGSAKKYGGEAAARHYVLYRATLETGAVVDQHRPGSKAWLDENGPWHAEPVYDPDKRGQVIVDGKSRLILRNKEIALLFKTTWG